MSNFTHKYDIQVGLDLTKILAPEAIPGIKAYLGVDNDNELLNAIAEDRYQKLVQALQEAGFGVIRAGFSRIEERDRDEQKNTSTSSLNEATDRGSSSEQKGDQLSLEEFGSALVSLLKDEQKKISANDGEIIKVDIDAAYISIAPNFDVIRKEVGLDDEMEFNFEELNDGVILISYTNPKKQQLQFKKISKEELVNAKG
ncbi:hypothetical protein [Limosilactobacillus reuteri]|uniref:hypothetical protein n=1 Tax=Limosilactobacillus reuteri TaxID=1598 RepID=UPI001C5AF74B|nr:hypothetical protein [Limosilactobacillus reuteri]MBW3350701.1 hypothetical protein [Limosilactobacillus reuteri]UUW69597.1 hypothetical protein NUJ10_11200 [Limosilactobacillus reuteri]